jgi:translation initiation factor 2 alpha subunit (eIF-2alpha)
MALEEGDIVLCTVEKIVGTTVFVKIDNEGDGSLSFSEVSPGRIRNIRDFVVPKKKITCKVLRISPNGHIDLSLRRVTLKEKKELKEKYKQEKSYQSIFKTIVGEKAEEIIETIKKDYDLFEFLEEAKTNLNNLTKIVGEPAAEKIAKILNSQKKKQAILKKQIQLTSKNPNGLTLIKDLLKTVTEAKIKYLAAGNYILELEAKDIKSADNQMKNILQILEKKAKKQDMTFIIKEK